MQIVRSSGIAMCSIHVVWTLNIDDLMKVRGGLVSLLGLVRAHYDAWHRGPSVIVGRGGPFGWEKK